MENQYLRLTKPLTVFLLAGHYRCNVFIGRHEALGNIYVKTELPVGTEIHLLVGGYFVFLGDEAVPYTATLKVSDKSILEKSYGFSTEEERRKPWLENSEPTRPTRKAKTRGFPTIPRESHWNTHGTSENVILDGFPASLR